MTNTTREIKNRASYYSTRRSGFVQVWNQTLFSSSSASCNSASIPIDTLIQTFDPFCLQRPIPRDERIATRFREYKNIGNSRCSARYFFYHEIGYRSCDIDTFLKINNRFKRVDLLLYLERIIRF